uniref:Lectin-like protein BA14k n=1 Tax=Mesocestoides corti TaxID=53468 RepID=A0A5K3FRK5_MESCO
TKTESDKPQFDAEIRLVDKRNYDYYKNTWRNRCYEYKQRVLATTNQFGWAKNICPKTNYP